MKDILKAPFVEEMCKTTANMYRLGWDERNGGNISYLLDEKEVGEYLDLNLVKRVLPLGFDATTLAGKIFIVTGSGKYFKNVLDDPEDNLGIVRISADGQNAQLLWGYSGGGKKMIAEYESTGRSTLLKGPRQYGLTQQHKHLKEMVKICGLDSAPVFCPIVGDFYSGMEVTVPLFAKDIKGSLDDIRALYRSYYASGLVRFVEEADPDGMLSACGFSGRDDMAVSVFGNDDRIILTSRFDNLGKGASGAAIQNMNILLGVDPTTGLEL